MTEKERFSAAVAKMRAVGKVEVTDWPAHDGRAAYRMACLRIDEPAAQVPARAADLAAFALELGGYLTMHPWRDRATFDIHVSRDLDAEETYLKPASVGGHSGLTDETR